MYRCQEKNHAMGLSYHKVACRGGLAPCQNKDAAGPQAVWPQGMSSYRSLARYSYQATCIRSLTAVSDVPLMPASPLQPVQLRQKDKVVLLPGDSSESDLTKLVANIGADEASGVPSIFEDLEEEVAVETRGRVTVYCIAGRAGGAR